MPRPATLHLLLALPLVAALAACPCGDPDPGPTPDGDGPAADGDAPGRGDLAPIVMTQATFGGLVDGKLPSAVDAERGVIVVEYFSEPAERDSRANKEGIIALSRRYCGRPLQAFTKKLQADLRYRSEQEGEGDFSCNDDHCDHNALGEYDVNGTYRFGAGPDGKPVLISVVHIEGGFVTDEFSDEGEAWAARELKRLDNGSYKDDGPEINRWLYEVCNTRNDANPGLPLRADPTWSKDVEDVRPCAQMPDGTLVEDLGGREQSWWRVQVFEGNDDGWVVHENVDKKSPQHGQPTLCPAR